MVSGKIRLSKSKTKRSNERKKSNVRRLIQKTMQAYLPFNNDNSSRLSEIITSSNFEPSELP